MIRQLLVHSQESILSVGPGFVIQPSYLEKAQENNHDHGNDITNVNNVGITADMDRDVHILCVFMNI